MPQHPPTCLIVEDSEADRFALRRVLLKLAPELRIAMATSLVEARQHLAAGRIDFVVLDNSLPDGNGADFVLDLSRNAAFADIPVLLVTGWPSPFLFAKAREAKVRHVVAKDQLRGDVTLALFRECIAAAKSVDRPDRNMERGPVAPVTERQRARARRVDRR
ncbi:response regulator [Tropicibacter sp. S64]|uniref:response regulator n=1 Tax=Tropicibacter sp. S64 TaxID=3415122 RepID=UPI003C7CD2C4